MPDRIAHVPVTADEDGKAPAAQVEGEVTGAELREATLEVLRGIKDLQAFTVKQLIKTLEDKYKVGAPLNAIAAWATWGVAKLWL